MFSSTHSIPLLFLVITCCHSYTAGNDEFITQFCLNMDTPEHMDSSTVQGRKNSTHFSYLATKSPVQQDYTADQLHTVTSHGITNDSQQLREAQEDPGHVREGQEDPHTIRKGSPFGSPLSYGCANGAAECCFEFLKKPFPTAYVVSYEETRSDCSVPGVILTTKRGYRTCADPEENWVKQIIANKNLDKTKTTNENFSPCISFTLQNASFYLHII
ncbi:hypothetical protein AMELA_G00057360 [Ameiurus melas]|uniref:Chemokine interleukin-8-like domain-containing protein n=1 Tax=Ameiurus melas TaxID=219545 RepID=A0A7J6B0M3_AMEME|nr:hypothetical protein AMELA_G00057360 [Ameiurus melas]